MNLQFSIEYKTYYGQELVLNIVNGKESGTNAHTRRLSLDSRNQQRYKAGNGGRLFL